MRNVDDSVKDSVLKKIHRFYQELAVLKKSTDYSQKNNLENLQVKLMEIVQQYALSIQPYEKEDNQSVYNEALYLLSVFTDEFFINTAWNGEYIWEDNLIEEQLFQTHLSGNKFFELIEANLKDTATDSREMSILYLLFLSTGFKGRFMFEDSDRKLNYYKKQLFISIYKTNPLILKEMKYIFPDAYASNQILGIRMKFYNLRNWILYSFLSFFIISITVLFIKEPESANVDLSNLKYFAYVNQAYIVAAIVVIIILILVYALITIYKRKELFQRIRKKITRFEIKESLRLLYGALYEGFPRSSVRDEIPLYLVIGSENSGNTSFLKNLKVKKIADSPFEEIGSSKSACNWYVLENCILIDPASKMDEDITKYRMWKYFIRRLKKLRRLRPLDGIIVTVSYEDLAVSGSSQMNNPSRIKTKADQLYAKLLYVQKKLRMQLPVYIVITKCDKIMGFEEFLKKLPNEYYRNIFGWSSPYNSNIVSYTRNWILEAFQNINSRLTYLLFGLCIEDTAENDFIKIFNLRNEVDSIKYPIQILTNIIFSIGQNTLLAPLTLRGIYFTGARSSRPEDIETAEKAFAYDLIDKKIIREAQLAKPARKIIIY